MWSVDLLTGERQARSDCQPSVSRHYTHRKKKNCRTLRRGKNRYHLAVGVSSRVKTFARKGAREGDGSAAMDTLSIRTFVTTPTRIHTFSLSHGDWQFLAFPQALWKGNTFIPHVDKHLLGVELSLLLLAWDSLHGLSLNLKVWICEGGRQTCEGVFPTIQI